MKATKPAIGKRSPSAAMFSLIVSRELPLRSGISRRKGMPERQAIAVAMRTAGKPKPRWYAVYEDGRKVSGSLSHAEATRAAVTMRERRRHGTISVRAVKA